MANALADVPVWAAEEDEAMVDLYIKGLLKICGAVSGGVLKADSEAVATSG